MPLALEKSLARVGLSFFREHSGDRRALATPELDRSRALIFIVIFFPDERVMCGSVCELARSSFLECVF